MRHRDLVVSTRVFAPYPRADSLHGLDDSHGRVVNTAQALYRCRLSCRDAFPSPDLKKEWATEVWNEACAKEAYPDLSRQDEEVGYHFFDIYGTNLHGFSVRN